MSRAEDLGYPPGAFLRDDESADQLFYVSPRFVVHLDEGALTAVGAYLGEMLPPGGTVLDLMSSWRSHFPAEYRRGWVVGLGLNKAELADNPQLDEHIVWDVNANPTLPFEDERFDAVIVTVSVQYMTNPVQLFGEVRRVLKPGASFHVIYSSRMFPTKAVALWKGLNASERAYLIMEYFTASGGWAEPEPVDRSPVRRRELSDPVFIVRARKRS